MTATDLAQALIGAAGNAKVREQAVKLYGEIITAQHAQLALLEDKRRLEAELNDAKSQLGERDDWGAREGAVSTHPAVGWP